MFVYRKNGIVNSKTLTIDTQAGKTKQSHKHKSFIHNRHSFRWLILNPL